MLEGFRDFKGYIQKELCPTYLEEIRGINNIGAFLAYKIINSKSYPYPDQPERERIKKFAEFVKIFSTSDAGLRGKAVPASRICGVALKWIDMMRNPMYYLWLFQKFTELDEKGIDLYGDN